MVSFRKGILLLALLVFAAGFASAQFGPLNCTLNGGAPPLLRAEGLAEEVGQAFIQCTGGNPFQPAIINVRVFTPGYNVTSRLLSNGKLEAALLIDDPAPGTVDVDTNAFFADPVPGNAQAVEWKNITFNPPGTAGVTRTLRMVNIRVNASAAGLTVTPTPVNLLVSVTGSLTLPLSSPFLVVGYIQKSLEVSVTGAKLSQCRAPEEGEEVVVTFKELIPNAWRTRGNATAQNNLQQIYNTESMYWDTTPTDWPADAGVATQATQLQVKFSNLPSGVNVGTVSGTFTASGGTTFSASTSGTTVTLTVTNTANVGASETLDVSVPVTYSGLPSIGTGSVSGSYAPTSTTITPIASPVPRFTDTGAASDALTISPCETRLLFPFVTSITGWDTGIAISNTSKDPWNTGHQSGTCTLYFYGTADSNQTTSVSIGAGQQMLMTMSGGNSAQGLSAVPNFTGYVIAVCNFQYAHGYAFISDLGANKFAQGYIALILGDTHIQNSARYGASRSEMLEQ